MDITNGIAKTRPTRTIDEHTNDLLIRLDRVKQLGYISEEVYSLVKKAIVYHDKGKGNSKFQERIKSNGRKKFNLEEEVPHNIISALILASSQEAEGKDFSIVLHAVINHHDYVNVREYLNDDRMKELMKEEIEHFNLDYDIDDLEYDLPKNIEEKKVILVKGLLHKCDYSASASLEIEYVNDFLQNALIRFITDIKKEDNNANWNEMQQYCIENEDENIIVVAQTGMGKTEGALLWINNNKGYFVLPLRTAINSIYKRITTNLLDKEEVITNKVSILHSSSLEYYLNKESKDLEYYEIEKYEKEGKQWSIPLNITTMDQIFDFVFKYQGYELKLATMSYSKVVVDEIQMYDPKLLAYLIYGLERIHEVGGKIAIVTATLPPFTYDILKKNIPFKDKMEFYNNDIKRHNVEVINKEICVLDIKEKYKDNIINNKSNKILVICNTVKKAQQVFSQLEEIMKGEEGDLHILHSRFTRLDRRNLEEEIQFFGETEHIGNGIWVATSIVEASLDIDFDYLFTELQDINSLFQRFGRCNRKGVKDASSQNCFVYTEIDNALLKVGNKGFIDKDMYEISKKALLEIKGLISEEEKIGLINKYFTSEALKNSEYLKEYDKYYKEIRNLTPYSVDKKNVILREIYTTDIIPNRVYDENYREIDEIEEKLKERELCKEERIKLKDRLMQFTVSIPGYEYEKYVKAVSKGKVERGVNITVDRFTNVEVMTCNYDKKGFSPAGYEINIGEGGFL